MGVFHILALLAAALPARVFEFGRGAFGRFRYDRRAVALVAGAALAVTFAAYEAEFARALAEVNVASIAAGGPLGFFAGRGGDVARAPAADILLGFAIAETVLLGAFLGHLEALGSRARRLLAGAVVLALAAVALASRSTDSPDPYLYAGLATLGVHAYQPPPVPFGPELRPVNAIWGTPMLASAYGPVWIALSAAVAAPFASLASKLCAFKVLGLASVLSCAYLARRLGASRVVVAGIACNPALYLGYVADAHNDLAGVDLVLAAMLAARRSPLAAFVLAVAASLVKLTLAPVALVACAAIPSINRRIAFGAALALAAGGAYAADGGLMWHALLRAATLYGRPAPLLDASFRAVLALVALSSAAWIVASGRIRAQAAWAFPAFGDFPLPQYLIWGLPLVLGSPRVAATYLVSLPLVAFLQSTVLPVTDALAFVSASLVVATIVAIAVVLRPATLARGGVR
jgi:hypothetical protein